MERFQGWAVNKSTGAHVGGATITVYTAGTLVAASIFDDTANPPTPKANPITADSDGAFSFYAANGRYDVRVSGTVPAAYTIPDITLGIADAGVLRVAEASLPVPASTAQAGRLALVTDTQRDVRYDMGSQWVSVSHAKADVRSFNARGDGVTDDTAAIQAAINTVAPVGGEVVFPRSTGWYKLTGPLSLAGLRAVRLVGLGGATAGAQGASMLRFTGTSSDTILDMSGAVGCHLADFQITWTGDFTGHAIKHWTDAQNCSFERMLLAGSANTAASCINFKNSYSSRVVACRFGGAVYGLLGRGDGDTGAYANVIEVLGCVFGTASLVAGHIRNIGQGWVIQGCTFEPLVDGSANTLSFGGTLAANGLLYAGNWHGDANGLGTWVDLRGNGLNVQGNYFATGALGIDLSNYPNFGVNLQGNTFDTMATGIKLPGSGGYACYGLSILGNSFPNVTTPIQNVKSGGTNHAAITILGNYGNYHASCRNLQIPQPVQNPPPVIPAFASVGLFPGEMVVSQNSVGSALVPVVGRDLANLDLALGGRTQTTVGVAGAASAPPATPARYLLANVLDDTGASLGVFKIPLYHS